jgi:DHHC palmitoyltransferase
MVSGIPTLKACLSTFVIAGTALATLALVIVNIYIPCLLFPNHPPFSPLATTAILLVHALLLGMTFWSLALVKLTNPGFVPRPKDLTPSEVRAIEAGTLECVPPMTYELESREFIVCDRDGKLNICETCNILRPARTSHCDALGRCVVKLDHFCPMLYSAIGVGNYKYYIQFLWWTLALAIYLQVIGFFALVRAEEKGWFLGLGTLVSIIGDMWLFPLFSMHLNLVASNVATREDVEPSVPEFHPCARNGECIQIIENERARKYVRCNLQYYATRYEKFPAYLEWVIVSMDISRRPWELDSKWENWCSVMGTHVWEWFLPLRTTNGEGNFWEFEFNERTKKELREKANEAIAEINRQDAALVFSQAKLKEKVEYN